MNPYFYWYETDKTILMKKILVLFLFMFAGLPFVNAQQQAYEDLLYELPDLIFTPIETPDGYQAAYELKIKQPLDHWDAAKGYFYQRAFLSHKGFDRPSVIITQGYDSSVNRIAELSSFLDANQIDVEHRYFGASLPDSLDYKYLNLKQATADLHHIRQLFGRIYQGKWVSSGISKGGATTIFYRYFYPDDVDLSVPYVAPINRELIFSEATDVLWERSLATIGVDPMKLASAPQGDAN